MLLPRDPDFDRWNTAFSVALAAIFGGVALLANSHLGSLGGIARGLAGLALIAGAVIGFRHFWLHKV